MRGSKFPADMHNYVWCPIYIPSFMIIGSVVSEELRWQDFGTDERTDRVTALLDLLSPSATQVKNLWVLLLFECQHNKVYIQVYWLATQESEEIKEQFIICWSFILNNMSTLFWTFKSCLLPLKSPKDY